MDTPDRIGHPAAAIMLHYLTSHKTFSLSLFGVKDDTISQTPQSMRLLVLFFLASSLQALVSSVLFHTHTCLAHYGTVTRFLCFDYSGISAAVLGAVLAVQHAAFLSRPNVGMVYLVVTASIGAMCITLPWTTLFNHPKTEPYRMFLFLLLGSMGLVPFAHICVVDGIRMASLLYAPVMRALVPDLLGAIAFGAKIPERWMPGKFDLIGSSHNIWHMGIALGIAALYKALHEMAAVSLNEISM